jgi:Tol biopolymer transport system component
MARSTAGRGRGTPRRTTGDPYGLAAARPFLAPLLSLAGLVVVGLITVALLTGSAPLLPTGGTGSNGGEEPGTGGPIVPGRTPSPSAPPVVNPDVGIDGQLVYAKAGNLWIQEGTTSRQLTDTGRDSQPTWAPDGSWVYFIDTRRRDAKFPRDGVVETYDLRYPVLTRIRPDGSGREAILSGLYRSGPSDRYAWAFFMRDPAVAPDGKTVAVVSDGPDPTKSNVVMARISISGQRLRPMGLAENPPYGHQDPAWSPDGTTLAYVLNARQSGRGAPSIWRYDLAKEKATRLSRTGYTEPTYSPDGRLLVATKTTSLGTDIVVLDARNGNELLRVTKDGRSWGGAWSPDGTQVAFLHLDGSTTDLSVATVRETPGGPLAVGEIEPLTEFSGLDADSRPAWWGPRPEPEPTPAPTPTPAP